ncbi:MAG: thiolase family protein [Anaerolineae bacterium]|nr:thiolase family protein [Anaerolineae bacterium]
MADVYIVDAVRTPVGRGKADGKLAGLRPETLAAHVLNTLVARVDLDPAAVEDVVMGCVTQTGEQGANIGRLAVMSARWPVTVPAVSVNRMCGSSQQAIHHAAQAIAAGDMDLAIGAGVEMMSRVVMGTDWPMPFTPDVDYDLVHQGISAEMMADKWGLSRDELDDYAYRSHVLAAEATRVGKFSPELAPVAGLEVDEGIRMEPDRARLGALKPAFKPNGKITAGNASQISDGAAAVLLASEQGLKRFGLRPRARLVSRVVVGDDPVLMLAGPIPGTRKALERAGLRLSDIAAVEINEAFASVVLAWAKELDTDLAPVNAWGGAIAIGHPLGASGARLMTTLLSRLEEGGGRYGLQTMCIGHGMATATVIERL